MIGTDAFTLLAAKRLEELRDQTPLVLELLILLLGGKRPVNCG